jgi:hypothetical protein
MIGHSLGSQLIGQLGRQIKKKSKFKLTRITGLDPPKLFHRTRLFTGHIDKNDATMVDIIHTDAGLIGTSKSTGTIDFWPNSGKRHQPGCELKARSTVERSCSHSRAWRFYAESVAFKSSTFASRKCGSWKDFSFGRCDGNGKVSMGINTPPG